MSAAAPAVSASPRRGAACCTPCRSSIATAKIIGMANGPRRTRLAKDLPDDIRGWLQRVARCHAHLCWLNGLHADRPKRAGGDSLLGATFQDRADARDRTLIYDACGVAADYLLEIRAEIEAVMDSAPATQHLPGTQGKVEAMRARSDAGFSIFIDSDPQIDAA